MLGFTHNIEKETTSKDNDSRGSKRIKFQKWKAFSSKYSSILVEEMHVYIVLGFFIHLLVYVHTAWKSDDNCQKSVLSSHHGSPRD